MRHLARAGLVLLGALLFATGLQAQTPAVLPAGTDILYSCASGSTLAVTQPDAFSVRVRCMTAPTATATAVATATATATVPPTATATPPPVAAGHHGPLAHGGLNVHEHGDAPPAWVLASAWPPFTQTRESHVGYKGAAASMANGVQSYFIAHILSTVAARSHGDHDYQLWMREPSGVVSYWEGVLDFGTPPPLQTVESSLRPVIQSIADGGCETWYSRPGALVVEVGWTICGRNATFAGVPLGDGTFRTVDWILSPSRFPGPGAVFVSPTLASQCVVQFNVCRFTFLVNSRDYGAAAIPN